MMNFKEMIEVAEKQMGMMTNENWIKLIKHIKEQNIVLSVKFCKK